MSCTTLTVERLFYAFTGVERYPLSCYSLWMATFTVELDDETTLFMEEAARLMGGIPVAQAISRAARATMERVREDHLRDVDAFVSEVTALATKFARRNV